MRLEEEDLEYIMKHLDERCFCDNGQHWDGKGNLVAHDACNGTGWLITYAGRELLGFLERHGIGLRS